MKSQVQMELMQLVNGSTKGKSKLASMIKRMQNNDENRISETSAKDSVTMNQPLINENKKTTDPFCFKTDYLKDIKPSVHINEKNLTLSDKFSTLVCPQPFNLQISRPLKKAFSMQQPIPTINSKIKPNPIEQPIISNSLNKPKHSNSFNNSKLETKGNYLITWL